MTELIPQGRLWLNIEELQISNLCQQPGDTQLYYSLHLGGLRIHSYSVSLNTTTDRLSYGGGGRTTAHFHQTELPYSLAGIPTAERPAILDNLLLQAVAEKHSDFFRAYLQKRVNYIDLPPWQPARWKGKTLSLAVDYVTVRNLTSGPTGVVYGDVRIGNYFTLLETAIFDGDNFSIIDPKPTRARITEETAIGDILRKLWESDERFRAAVRHFSLTIGTQHNGIIYRIDVPSKELQEKKEKAGDELPEPPYFWDGKEHTPVPRSIIPD